MILPLQLGSCVVNTGIEKRSRSVTNFALFRYVISCGSIDKIPRKRYSSGNFFTPSMFRIAL